MFVCKNSESKKTCKKFKKLILVNFKTEEKDQKLYLKIKIIMTQSNKRTLIIGEIGINHNGSIDIAKKLIDMAKECGCDAVKYEKNN